MAKPLLLLLHGVGEHSTTWADSLTKCLDAIAATFPTITTKGTFSSQVVVQPIHYDSVFDAQLDRWETQAGKVDGFVKDTGVKMPRLVGLLEDNLIPPAERGFVWTGVLDAVSYRGITLTRDDVRVRVMKDIVAAINAHLKKEPGAQVSIMAHSLGTIVAHDVLHLLGTGKKNAGFKTGQFQFTNVFLLANATRLGPSKFIDIPSGSSIVRPVSAGPNAAGQPPYCAFLYNVNNRWDPIASWARFQQTNWGTGFIDVPLRHIHQVNVHGYQHYLKHPDVHCRLFRALLGNDALPRDEWQRRSAAFTDLPPTCNDVVASLMNQLDIIRDGVQGGDLDDVAMGIVKLYRAVSAARKDCESLFNSSDGQL